EGATITVAFVTAGYALNHLARLAPGERVLIHAASGGVGLAAVQLAQQAGAEIFATAGSPRKRAYLRSLGIRHIMDSRSLDFAGEIRKITGGEGVDVVLNSLAGDFIRTSLSLLRQGGRFLEIGKTGILDKSEAARLRPDVSYHTIALDRLTEMDAAVIGSLLKKLSAELDRGDLKPLPQRVFAMEHAVEAFRFMAQAKHIGKVVVSQVEAGRNGTESSSKPKLLKADSTYLITGGLGALGLMVARWMVQEGARNLVLMGRNSPSTSAAETVRELNESGARVVVVQGDAARQSDVAGLLAETGRTMPPLRGVIHAAGVLEDGMMEQQPWNRFVAAMPAKMQGAWNLHELTQSASLDFFILFSSVASAFGSPGQGNYAAANAFLDALAHHRRALGLPALSVNWGPWAEAGFAAKAGARGRDRWTTQGVGSFRPEQGLGLLGHLLGDDAAQVVALAVEWPKFVRQFPLGEGTPFFTAMAAETSLGRGAAQPAVEHADLRRRLQEARPQEAREFLRDYLRSQVAQLLGFDPAHPLDTGQGLLEMGMDSLMAVDFRNRLLTALGRSFSPTVVFDYPTIDALTDYLAREMIDVEAAPAEQPKSDRAELPAALQRLEELSEEEAEAYLAAKLKEKDAV
ncbi:MAG TPA: type I polyketide synthase, partial [Opitutaceae bacterium]|nr:type I polyketide synthase [Opitutaceae bacterium]